MITRETISQSEQRWDPSAVGWITVSSLCFQGTDQPTMKSQCWGREAKPCLSERSGCCSLLKCQVLLKNNTPSSLSVSIPSSVSALPPPHQTPASAGAEVEEWTLGLVSPSQRGKLQRFFYLQKFCLYIYIYIYLYYSIFLPSHLPRGHWGGNSKGDEMNPFLFFLVLTSQLPSHFFPRFFPFHPLSLLTFPMMWCALL